MTETKGNKAQFTLASAAGLVISTTLRLAIPSISGTVIGVILDNNLDTAPLWTIVGILLGVAVAATLVYLQIKQERKV